MNEAKRPVALEDLCSYRFVSGPELSPDAACGAFLVHQAKPDRSGYQSDLWACSLTGEPAPHPLTHSGDIGAFCWEGEGQLLFSSRRRPGRKENETDYYRLTLSGGEAQPAFTVPGKVKTLRPLGPGQYLVTVDRYHGGPDANTQNPDNTVPDYTIFDELPFWKNGQGVTNKLRRTLCLFTPADGQLQPISPQWMNVEGFEIAGDGEAVLFYGPEYRDVMTVYHKAYRWEVSSRSLTCLLEDGQLSIDASGVMGDCWMLAASEQKRYETVENPWFYALNWRTGERRLAAEYDRCVGGAVGTDCHYGAGAHTRSRDGAFTFLTIEGYRTQLWQIDPAGRMTQLHDGQGFDTISSYDLRGGKLFCVAMADGSLEEVWTVDLTTKQARRLTALNDAALDGCAVSRPRYLPFTDSDGVAIDGWVLEPVGYDPNRTYPAILNIHGGPKAVYGETFFHEMQYWAGKGYFVLFSNPRGGDGKGNDFADLRGRYGTIDYRDLMEFCDHVLAQYPQIDPSRMACAGGSYGGFMVNWIIGHTSRFAAAASQRSISNYLSKCLTTDIGYYHNLSQTGSDPWSGFDKMWEQSPVKYADRCTTPTLFIHSEEDYRCWMSEGIQMFSGIRQHGVPARICLFKGENHELSRSGMPRHRLRRLTEITSWFDRYTAPKQS